MSNQVTFTQYESSKPLSKRFWLENGQIHKQAAAQMTRGTAERVTMPFLEFSKALESATDKHAFGYGTHALSYPDKVNIVVSSKEKPEQNILSRTKANYAYRNGTGVAMLDHDPSDYGQSMTTDKFVAALVVIHPQIAQAARIVRGSISAGVHKVGEQPRNDKGFHVYIPVINAADIPRWGNVLFDRLWLTGFGYIALSKSGAMLERTFIDASVFSPERLDFVGKPIITGTGLQYTPPEIIYTEGGLLDTETLHDLTDNELAELARLKADAKASIKSKAESKHTEWAGYKVQAMQAAGATPEQAHATIDKILKSGFVDLYDDFILDFPSGAVSVAAVLSDPRSFDGKALADPIEGKSYGSTTAIFYWNKGAKPFINSQAHGGCKYFLHNSTAAGAEDWKAKLDAHVETFNKTHASVLIGGKHKIMRFIEANATHDRRASYEFFSREELSKLHDHEVIQTGINRNSEPTYRNHLMAWAKHNKARTYTGGVVFLPDRKAPANCFNTWSGFSVEPKQNDDLLEPILSHIKETVCAGNEDLYDYFIKWTAYTIQNPNKPAGAAIVLRGEKGSGKGTIGHFLKDLWGHHGLHISNAKHLVGNFNGHLADVCFLFADEAFYSGDRQHEGVLKALITEPTVTIERKGVDAISQPNYLKIFMATNADFAVPASRDERRYFVADVSSARIGDKAYFNALHAACDSKDVQAAFLYSMLNVDLTGFKTGDIPESKGLRAQRYHSMNSAQKWLVDCLIKGGFKDDIGIGGFPFEILASELYASFVAWCDTAKTGEYKRMTQTMFGRYMSSIYKKHRNGVGRFVYRFGHLNDAVAAFEAFEKISIEELEGIA